MVAKGLLHRLRRDVLVDALFIEAPLPPPHFPAWIKLSPRYWGVISRIWWHAFNHHEGQETRADAEVRADQAAQVMDADAELPFMRPPPRRIQRPFITTARLAQGPLQDRVQFLDQPGLPRPRCEEAACQHAVQNGRMARQIGGQRGRRPADVDDQVDQLGIGLEQREQLDPCRQAGQETVEAGQRLGRVIGQQVDLDHHRRDALARRGVLPGVGKDRRRRTPGEHGADHRLLTGTQLIETEDAFEGGHALSLL